MFRELGGRAMRHFFCAGMVVAAGLMLPAGERMLAQTGDAAGAGQGPGGQGAGQGRRGGFGGGQAVQGTVTAATADKVTIQTDAGDSYTVTVTANTRILRDRQPIKLADVKVGDGVTAMGAVDGSAKTVAAMMVMDVDAETVKKSKEDMGKTYITGKITAIDADNLKLTVMRSDNVSQAIGVDEGTSFQRGARGIAVPSGMGMTGPMGGGMGGGGRGMGGGGGNGAAAAPPESITLADVKVGDMVVATGGLKGGVFVPVKLGVSEPGVGGGRRRGAGESPTVTPSGQTVGAPAPPSPPPAPPQ
jgi:hypothetical protein